MAQLSPIEWTDVTWNPVAGCTVASAGCTNCYAMRMAARLEAMGIQKYAGLTRKSGNERALSAPLSWRKPRTVFVNSMSDLFHDDVDEDFIQQVWAVMRETPQHTYQVLTKRPDRMQSVLSSSEFRVLPNVWVGTSVEDAPVASRIDHLRATPAAIRFVSFEPLIGPVGSVDLNGIDWAIVGGESGPNARPMNEEWALHIRDLCGAAKVAFFFKQWGGIRPKSGGRKLKGREWNQYPKVHGLVAQVGGL
jgi:protein gp37